MMKGENIQNITVFIMHINPNDATWLVTLVFIALNKTMKREKNHVQERMRQYADACGLSLLLLAIGLL